MEGLNFERLEAHILLLSEFRRFDIVRIPEKRSCIIYYVLRILELRPATPKYNSPRIFQG
jgi:hypothetical protein